MVERKYMVKKRATVKTLAFLMFIWMCFLAMLYLLAERGFPPTTKSVLSASLVVLSAVIVFGDTCSDVYRIFNTPQIIIADTVLILGFGKTILNWEDINKISISRGFITIYRKARIFRWHCESIGGLVNKSDFFRDLERQCAERNLTMIREG